MYSVQDIVEDLLKGEPIKKIARIRRISKNTVKKYRKIVQDILDRNSTDTPSIDGIMEEVRKIRKKECNSMTFGWLADHTDIVEKLSTRCENYVRLLEVLQNKGFQGSYSSLHRFLEKDRAQSEKPIVRIETEPGKIAQVDFGHIRKIYDEYTKEYIKGYVFVMVLGFSRDAYYEIVKTQDVTTWCNCHAHAFEFFGGVPEVIIPDNLKSAIIKASFMDPIANKSYADLARHYNFQIDPCLPGTPEHKGKVESGVKYVKKNFMPLREFKNFTDANDQLAKWNENKARVRIHGTTRRQPKELFEKHEQEALRPLPCDRFEIPIWKNPKVGADIHVQVNYAYYSVPHELRGEYVWARRTSSQLAIFYENKLVAVHFPALQGKRRTHPEHYPPDQREFMKWNTDHCIAEAGKIGVSTLHLIQKLLLEEPIRNLRSAQNILRKANKYGNTKLEEACACAVYYRNYTYMGIKNILEKDLDTTSYIDSKTSVKQLDASYARNINQLINQEAANGNNGTNKI